MLHIRKKLLHGLKSMLSIMIFIAGTWLTALYPTGLFYDTLLPLASGAYVKVQDLVVGQRLVAFNNCSVTVARIEHVPVKHLVCIELTNRETLYTALEQKFFCAHEELRIPHKGCCWTPAMDLYPGAKLRALGVFEGWVEVASVEVLNIKEDSCTMIKLITRPNHLFCITRSLIVAHASND